jgi:hypothetical protein
MNKEVLFTLIRAVVTFAGAYLVGKPFLGGTVDENLTQVIIGIAMSLSSIAWSVFDKSLNIEMLQAFLRSVATGIGGFLVANGKISPAQLDTYLGLALAILVFAGSLTAKKKAANVISGKIDPSAMKTLNKPV